MKVSLLRQINHSFPTWTSIVEEAGRVQILKEGRSFPNREKGMYAKLSIKACKDIEYGERATEMLGFTKKERQHDITLYGNRAHTITAESIV